MDVEIKSDKWGDIWCAFRRIPIYDRIIIVYYMIIDRNWHISYYRITNERKVDKIDAISWGYVPCRTFLSRCDCSILCWCIIRLITGYVDFSVHFLYFNLHLLFLLLLTVILFWLLIHWSHYRLPLGSLNYVWWLYCRDPVYLTVADRPQTTGWQYK